MENLVQVGKPPVWMGKGHTRTHPCDDKLSAVDGHCFQGVATVKVPRIANSATLLHRTPQP